MLKAVAIVQIRNKTLNENTVDAVILHPLKMTQDGWFFVGTEHFSWFAAGEGEIGLETLGGRQFRDVRPEIHLGIAIFERASMLGPVPPSRASAAIAGGGKPALITAHHLAVQGAGINAFCGDARVGSDACIQIRILAVIRHGIDAERGQNDSRGPPVNSTVSTHCHVNLCGIMGIGSSDGNFSSLNPMVRALYPQKGGASAVSR